jgi:hypothetical protein
VVITQIDDSIVLDCYRLASHYKLDPRVFLEMPISEVQLHAQRTIEVIRADRAASAPGD